MPDILIRGMEMPTSCGKCRFAGVCGVHPVDEWPDLESIITNDVIGVDGERDKGCPLVPLPSHGDLIDRDALPLGRVEWEDIDNATVIVPASEEENANG